MPKTRTTKDIKPGMVIRSTHHLTGSTSAAYRQVATVTRPTPWAERLITFTDGTSQMYSLTWEFDVATSKTQRNAAKQRAASKPASVLESVFMLLGAYATAA